VTFLGTTGLPSSVAYGSVVFAHDARQRTIKQARRSIWISGALTAAITVAIVAALELASGWMVPFFFVLRRRGRRGGPIDPNPPWRRRLRQRSKRPLRRRARGRLRRAGDNRRSRHFHFFASVDRCDGERLRQHGGRLGVTISSAIGLGVLLVGLAYTSPRRKRGTRSATIPREMAAESALTGEASRSPDPLLRTVSNK
jgi:hypothetical protein